jgi:hypothetical protein
LNRRDFDHEARIEDRRLVFVTWVELRPSADYGDIGVHVGKTSRNPDPHVAVQGLARSSTESGSQLAADVQRDFAVGIRSARHRQDFAIVKLVAVAGIAFLSKVFFESVPTLLYGQSHVRIVPAR